VCGPIPPARGGKGKGKKQEKNKINCAKENYKQKTEEEGIKKTFFGS